MVPLRSMYSTGAPSAGSSAARERAQCFLQIVVADQQVRINKRLSQQSYLSIRQTLVHSDIKVLGGGEDV